MHRLLVGSVKRGLKAVWSRFVEWSRKWTQPDNHGLLGGVVADATRSKAELMLENALLRQQLIVLDRQVKRPQLSWRERGIMVLLASTPVLSQPTTAPNEHYAILSSGVALRMAPNPM
jgi:hypothetical protein